MQRFIILPEINLIHQYYCSKNTLSGYNFSYPLDIIVSKFNLLTTSKHQFYILSKITKSF